MAEKLTVRLKMEEGYGVRVDTIAKHMLALVRVLRSIERKAVGKATTEWILVGVDLKVDGFEYTLQGFPKGTKLAITEIPAQPASLPAPEVAL